MPHCGCRSDEDRPDDEDRQELRPRVKRPVSVCVLSADTVDSNYRKVVGGQE